MIRNSRLSLVIIALEFSLVPLSKEKKKSVWDCGKSKESSKAAELRSHPGHGTIQPLRRCRHQQLDLSCGSISKEGLMARLQCCWDSGAGVLLALVLPLGRTVWTGRAQLSLWSLPSGGRQQEGPV